MGRLLFVVMAAWLSVAALVVADQVAGQPVCTPRPTEGRETAAASAINVYGWPVKPFHRQHPVRGILGDPRTIFSGPPTRDTVLHGGGEFDFHKGIDIVAAPDTPVYPVRDGRVTKITLVHTRESITVDSRQGHSFEYWHVRPRVSEGQWVTAEKTVLGTVLPEVGHVHLTELRYGCVLNPLAPGHLTPYTDRTVPRVAAVIFQTAAGDTIRPNLVRGRVLLVANAYDTASMPVPGAWHGMPVVPALLTWRIQSWTGKVVVPTRVAADFRISIPPRSAFWRIYARGTFQNMAAFSDYYSYLHPGVYLFKLTPLPFDTRQLRDGVYDLVVTAADIRGNSSSLTRRFTIHNRPRSRYARADAAPERRLLVRP